MWGAEDTVRPAVVLAPLLVPVAVACVYAHWLWVGRGGSRAYDAAAAAPAVPGSAAEVCQPSQRKQGRGPMGSRGGTAASALACWLLLAAIPAGVSGQPVVLFQQPQDLRVNDTTVVQVNPSGSPPLDTTIIQV